MTAPITLHPPNDPDIQVHTSDPVLIRERLEAGWVIAEEDRDSELAKEVMEDATPN